jgi:FAD/FMN-containing dehydrogenase
MAQPQSPAVAILESAAIQDLQISVRGEIIQPGDPAYESARAVWNGMIDKHPALIVRCTGVADVISAVQFARSQQLPVAIRGGGHNVAGNAVCDDGLVIDLSRMKGIRVDPHSRRAQAQAGLTWGEFDRETQVFGLATTGGLVSTTGIAGLTLGGGIGWLMRAYGLTCDNLLAAEIVTADGQVRTASATDHPDLFWGLRGGGGNFGVVTSFTYQLHPVAQVLGGMVLYPADQAPAVLRFYRNYVTAIPDELTTLVVFLTVPPLPFLPAHLHGTPAVAVAVCYTGDIPAGEQAVRALRTFGPPAVDLIAPMLYTALQSMFDAAAPAGLLSYWKATYLQQLSDEAIEAIIDHASRMPLGLSAVHIHQLGGTVHRVGKQETAFANRDAAFALNLPAVWADPAASAQHIQWVRTFFAALQPFSTGGVYVNFLGEEGMERVQAAYGDNYARLVALKARYDPTNFFHFNQNITPGT